MKMKKFFPAHFPNLKTKKKPESGESAVKVETPTVTSIDNIDIGIEDAVTEISDAKKKKGPVKKKKFFPAQFPDLKVLSSSGSPDSGSPDLKPEGESTMHTAI